MKHNDAVIRQYCRAVGKQLPLPAAQRRQLLAGLREELTEAAQDCASLDALIAQAGTPDEAAQELLSGIAPERVQAYQKKLRRRYLLAAVLIVLAFCCAALILCAGAHGQLCSIRGGAYHHPAHDRSVRSRTIASGGHQTFVAPFPSTYEPARIVRMCAGSLLPEYPYRFAAAAAPVVQTAGPGMPPAALSFPSCRKRLPDIQKVSPGRSGGD